VEREVTKRMMTIKMSRIPMHTVLRRVLKGSINGSTEALVSGSIIGDGVGHWLIVHTTRVHSTINGHMVILCRAPGHFALLDGLGAMSPVGLQSKMFIAARGIRSRIRIQIENQGLTRLPLPLPLPLHTFIAT
jgi:hypothetical protein